MEYLRKPEWLKIKLHGEKNRTDVEEILKRLSLNTVCKEANCPNRVECYGRKTATFMILGKYCTRNCTFCVVQKNIPEPVDPEEPSNVARAVSELNLEHVVITSVTRDDLSDNGSRHFAKVTEEIKKLSPNVVIELLIPDFQGSYEALSTVVNVKPHIINHNIETVPRLYPEVRPMAIYERSLELLKNAKLIDKNILTKSGIMVGLGENKKELISVFKDLREVDCDFLTIGQYIAPSKQHHPVVEYIHPNTFEEYRILATQAGFKHVASAPLVRSSYHAERMMQR